MVIILGKTAYRIIAFIGVILCVLFFAGSIVQKVQEHWAFSHNSVTGFAELANEKFKPERMGNGSMVTVNIKGNDGSQITDTLFFPSNAVDRLLDAEKVRVTYLKDNHQRRLLTGERLSPIIELSDFGLLLVALVCWAIFKIAGRAE